MFCWGLDDFLLYLTQRQKPIQSGIKSTQY
jgi:hypothetical protein